MKKSKLRVLVVLIAAICFIAAYALWRQSVAEPMRIPDFYSGAIIERLSEDEYSYKFTFDADYWFRNFFNSIKAAKAEEPNSSKIWYRITFASHCGQSEGYATIGKDAQICIVDIYEEGFQINETFYSCSILDVMKSKFELIPSPIYTDAIQTVAS